MITMKEISEEKTLFLHIQKKLCKLRNQIIELIQIQAIL
jgi:hypothetical protein